MLLEVLPKSGEEGISCLDTFTKLSKSSPATPTNLLALCCMIKLIVTYKSVEYPNIYFETFQFISDHELIDTNVKISLKFLDTVTLLLTSTHLPILMLTKILRQLAILATCSARSEITHKIVSILQTQKIKNPTNSVWSELATGVDFSYISKNTWEKPGASSIHPEI